MDLDVKICGLSTAESVAAAVGGGARFVGFVFFAPSPRFVSPEQATRLAADVPPGVARVGLVVDADDAALAAIVASGAITMLQLHGSEPPRRVAEVRRRFALPVMKAVAIASAGDLGRAAAYEPVADWLLFDGKPPAGADRPGGNAVAFDWTLLRGRAWRRPWMLAGGIDAENLAAAVNASGARVVDVSSGVEKAPGEKSVEKIRALLRLAARL